MGAYYNEYDPLAAQTIREAIAAGVIVPGDVDERDIRDVRPTDLAGYTQVHLFAGGGIWSYALRRAGWPDDRPIWTCSCPCQPFSTAGKGNGFADERHLWPAAEWLIRQCEPVVIAGEQVADKGADPWVDLVQADLEALDYAFGIVPLASAGFGAPNIRHRSFWLAYALSLGCEGIGRRREEGITQCCDAGGLVHSRRASDEHLCGSGEAFRSVGTTEGEAQERQRRRLNDRHTGTTRWLADANDPQRRQNGSGGHERNRPHSRRTETAGDTGECDGALWMAHPMRAGRAERRPLAGDGQASGSRGTSDRDPGPTNGFWRDADWLLCRDPGGRRWRPVDAGTFPLAPGHPGRVGGLRISGNAINAEVASAFIEAVADILFDPSPYTTGGETSLAGAEPIGSAHSAPRPLFHNIDHAGEVADGGLGGRPSRERDRMTCRACQQQLCACPDLVAAWLVPSAGYSHLQHHGTGAYVAPSTASPGNSGANSHGEAR